MDWFWMFLAWLTRLPPFEAEVAGARMMLRLTFEDLFDLATAPDDFSREDHDAILRNCALWLTRLNAYAGCLIHQRARQLAGRPFQPLREPRFAEPRRVPTIDALMQAILALHRRLDKLERSAARLAPQLAAGARPEPECSWRLLPSALAAILPSAHARRALDLSG